jgi:hypothetical protein
MTNLKVLTDKNVCLNFPPSLLDPLHTQNGIIRISIQKDALSSLIRENQKCSLTLDNRRRLNGRIRGIVSDTAEKNMVLSLKVEKQKETP